MNERISKILAFLELVIRERIRQVGKGVEIWRRLACGFQGSGGASREAGTWVFTRSFTTYYARLIAWALNAQ